MEQNRRRILNRQVPDSRHGLTDTHHFNRPNHYPQQFTRPKRTQFCERRFGCSLEQTQPKPHRATRNASTPLGGALAPYRAGPRTPTNSPLTPRFDLFLENGDLEVEAQLRRRENARLSYLD